MGHPYGHNPAYIPGTSVPIQAVAGGVRQPNYDNPIESAHEQSLRDAMLREGAVCQVQTVDCGAPPAVARCRDCQRAFCRVHRSRYQSFEYGMVYELCIECQEQDLVRMAERAAHKRGLASREVRPTRRAEGLSTRCRNRHLHRHNAEKPKDI